MLRNLVNQPDNVLRMPLNLFMNRSANWQVPMTFKAGRRKYLSFHATNTGQMSRFLQQLNTHTETNVFVRWGHSFEKTVTS